MKFLKTIVFTSLLASSLSLALPRQHHHQPARNFQAQSSVVDINKASALQLATIKGLGQKRAAAIVAYRQQHGRFSTVDGLTKVKGVGPKLLARMKLNNKGRLKIGRE